MSKLNVIVTEFDMVTAYGRGLKACWDGLLSNKTAIKKFSRFPPVDFSTSYAAMIDGVLPGTDSLVWQMLKPLLESGRKDIPKDACLILSTAVGEIDFLERAVLSDGDVSESNLKNLLEKVGNFLGLSQGGILVSAACASSSAAVAIAADMISSGKKDCCLIVACDGVSEFVYSGFSSLMGLDKVPARPFDRARAGLSLGEGAGYILLMSEERAKREAKKINAKVIGWGMSNDSNHMTSPSREGNGLAAAIKQALSKAKISASDIGSICAHGTGTLYNDLMEMKAFQKVFLNPIPVYSVKGATGHTLGAAGLLEIIICIKSLQEKLIPGTVGLSLADDEAVGWVNSGAIKCDNSLTLSVNAGFGGVNAAVVISK
jgi:3-oxoacyl-[acyl-carrier-protein] synthase II